MEMASGFSVRRERRSVVEPVPAHVNVISARPDPTRKPLIRQTLRFRSSKD